MSFVIVTILILALIKILDKYFFKTPLVKIKSSQSFSRRAQNMSPIQWRMYYALKRAGYDPIPEYPECGYYLDFAIFQDDIKLDVECDGRDFHSSPEQKAHDRKRTRVLNRNGWKVIRFTGSQINTNTWRCVKRIDTKLGDLVSKRKEPQGS